MKEKFLIIANLHAGAKRGEKDWPIIKQGLDDAGFDCSCVFTKYRGHAIEIASENILKGCKNIIGVGGDGTLNEIVNGVFLQKEVPYNEITIGMIPVGTGNDWCRTFNIPNDYLQAIEVIKNKKTVTQDVAKISFHNFGKEDDRYFVNVAGMGFDAVVLRKSNQDKETGKVGNLVYYKNILSSLFKHKSLPCKIYIDNDSFEADVFSLNAGLCKYSGGGMMQVPNAVFNDGMIDVTIINRIRKLKVIRNIKKLYDGSFINLKEVQTHKTKCLRVESKHNLLLEADGEFLGNAPAEFSVVPNALSIISNFY